MAISAAYGVLVSEWDVAQHSRGDICGEPDGAFARVTEQRRRREDRIASRERPPGAYSYTTPANLVLFVFLTLLVTSSGLVEARRNGLMRRMLASPTWPRVIVRTARELSILGLVQAAGLLVIGCLVFGVRWGDPLGVLLLWS